jgi:hypothetical protein
LMITKYVATCLSIFKVLNNWIREHLWFSYFTVSITPHHQQTYSAHDVVIDDDWPVMVDQSHFDSLKSFHSWIQKTAWISHWNFISWTSCAL